MTARINAIDLADAVCTTPDIRLLDVRTAGEFESERIPGSHNIPLDQLDVYGTAIAGLDTHVVLICQSGGRATRAANQLARYGTTNLSVLDGGINAWRQVGQPTKRIKQRWALERQVRLVAGAIVLIAVIASTAVPALKWVAAAIGAGLTFAALTDTCAMGMLLARLPYNSSSDRSDDAERVARLIANDFGRATSPTT